MELFNGFAQMNKLIILVLFLFPAISFADYQAYGSNGILTDMGNIFEQSIGNLGDDLKNYSNWLLYTLLGISFTIRVGLKFIGNSYTDIGEVLLELVSTLIYAGILFWIIDNSYEMVIAVIKSFAALALDSAEVIQNLRPGDIINSAWKIHDRISEKASVFNIAESLESWFLSWVILVIYSFIAMDLLFIQIAMYVLAYVSPLFFALWGLEQTRGVTHSFIMTVIAFGFRMFGLFLVVGIGISIINNMIVFIDQTDGFFITQGYLSRVFVSILILWGLSIKVPDMLGSIVGHQGQSGFMGGSGSKAMIGASQQMTAAAVGMVAASKAISSYLESKSGGDSSNDSDSGGGSLSGGGSFSSGSGSAEAKAASSNSTVLLGNDGSLSFGGVKDDKKQSGDSK